MSTYIVGDIQGCYDGLLSLLAKVGFEKGRDTLWSVGDLIARGPKSLETLVYLHSLKDGFRCVLGNHDLHLLAITQGVREAKESDNLHSLLSHSKLYKYVEWLRHMPLAAKVDKHTLISHAGLYPKWGFDTALKCSEEVETHLRHKKWHLLLQAMYGSEPRRWKKTLSGVERYRFIINALTRMRYVDASFNLEFDNKSHPSRAPEGLFPWFVMSRDKLKPKQRVVFGHWAALQGQTDTRNAIALDTGYVWGNQLTCLKLETGELIQVDSPP